MKKMNRTYLVTGLIAVIICVKETVLRDFAIKRHLPLKQPVVITLTPKMKGEFDFTCGMNMIRGKLIVQ